MPNENLRKLFPYGYLGAVNIALRSYRQTSWEDTDFIGNIKVKLVAYRYFFSKKGTPTKLFERLVTSLHLTSRNADLEPSVIFLTEMMVNSSSIRSKKQYETVSISKLCVHTR